MQASLTGQGKKLHSSISVRYTLQKIFLRSNVYKYILVYKRGVLGREERVEGLALPMTLSFLKHFNLFRPTLIYLSLLDTFEPPLFVYLKFLVNF